MKIVVATVVGTVLLASSALALAADGPITKQQAIDMALKARPGAVIKAYQERKRGADAWEVQVKSKDGQRWALYYALADGRLITVEQGVTD